jgi:cell division protein FtsI (penicillin-binding protein 3)
MASLQSSWECGHTGEIRRIRMLGVIFSLFMTVLMLRAFQFQVWKREPWRTMAPRQYQSRVKLQAERGVIYDRNMNILAMDLPISCVAIDPSQIKDTHTVAESLAHVLGDREEFYRNLIEKNMDKNFVWVKKDITDAQNKALLSESVPGIIPIRGRKRTHPYQQVAYQVLGVTNIEHRGVGGIEQVCDERLRGEDGWAIYQKDGYNRSYSSLDYPIKESRNGHHIVLTLDHAYQTVVEEELIKGVHAHSAKSGCVVLLDPFTGEILSMASAVGIQDKMKDADFNERLQNKAVQLAYEPGSTFKIVTAAAALEEGLYTPTSLIHCENGEYRLANHIIHDHDKAYDWLTLGQILENSSNIGMAKIGRKLGKEIVCKYAQNFGFGNKTGVGLPGEVSGILPPIYLWTDFSTAIASFGQGISSTALQVVSMVSAIANGGELIRPQIVKSVLDDKGNEIESFARERIRRVVSKTTADQLKTILEDVVLQGSGREAAVNGVRIAGKTGTSQKSVPGYRGYLPGVYISSFVGFWPSDTPFFAMVVVLDEPRQRYWGAQSAAPIFSRIVERITGMPMKPWHFQEKNKNNQEGNTVLLSVLYAEESRQPAESDREVNSMDSPYHMPRLIGLSVREALQKMATRGMTVELIGSGVVVKQEPEKGVKVENNEKCRLYCQEIN